MKHLTWWVGVVFFRLVNRQLEEWGDRVTIVSSDMREWQAPEKVLMCTSQPGRLP